MTSPNDVIERLKREALLADSGRPATLRRSDLMREAASLIKTLREASDSFHRRMVAAEAKVNELTEDDDPHNSHRDTIAGAAIVYQCADCLEEESEFSCHPRDNVVICGGQVICLEHAKEFHRGERQDRVPDIAAKVKRQRAAIASQTTRAEAAEAALTQAVETEREECAMLAASMYEQDPTIAASAADPDLHTTDWRPGMPAEVVRGGYLERWKWFRANGLVYD